MRKITLSFTLILAVLFGFSQGTQIDLPVTFDDVTVDYTLTDFEGNSTVLGADPDDPTNTVAITDKTVGAQTFAGTTISTPSGFASPVPITATETKMSIRVYSPLAGIAVRLKVEDATDPTKSVETETNTTVANAWETLEFDFSNEAPGTAVLDPSYTLDKASVFFNFGAVGSGLIYYWDDVEFVTGGPAQIDLPVTFEDAGVDYTLTDFEGNSTALGADPDDPTNTVAITDKTVGAQFFAGTTIGTPSGFASPIPFTAAATKMSMRVYSPLAGAPIRLKVEDATDPTKSVETETNTTVANAWETLEFDFSNEVPGTAVLNLTYTLDKASVFFNFGAVGSGLVYYWDDVAFIPDTTITPGGGESPYCSTETLHFGADPGSVIFLTIANQDATSMYVEIESADSDPVDLLLVLGGSGATISDEDTSVAGKIRRTLTWGVAPDSVSLNLLWSKESFGGNWQLSLTDITLAVADTCPPPMLDQIDLPVTFEDAGVDYTLTDFEGNSTVLGADPIDPANTVAITDKTVGAQFFAGTTISTPAGFATPIPFTATDTKMSIRVYSPLAGIPVRLKVEDATDPTKSVETETNTTVANAWETLEFDFSNEVPGTAALNLSFTFDKASVFFNFGAVGSGLIYYWDDVEFVPSGLSQIDLPVTFEDATVDYSLLDFEGTSTVLGADPVDPSNTVAITDKTVGAQFFAGTIIGTDAGFANPVPFTATDTRMSMRVYSPLAGIPVRLKVENSSNPAESVETETNTTVANAWETLEFDFSNEVPGTAALDLSFTYDKAVVFFNFGAVGSGLVYYWDDVAFVAPPPLDQIDLPVTFEDAGVDYSLIDFNGTSTVLGADPVDPSNTVAITDKTAGAEFFAGTIIGTDAGFANPVPFTATDTRMSMRVYSPLAGIPVRLKVEDSNDPTRSVETETNTTVANAWETLEFDFSNEVPGTATLNLSFTYDKAVVFFNFGAVGSGLVYYWDDVAFVTAPPSACGPGETEVILTINPGSFPAEVHWELLNSAGDTVASVDCNTYVDATLDVDTLCLTDGETYTFNAYDDYGDGWNGGTFSIARAGDDCVLIEGLPNNGTPGDDEACGFGTCCGGSDLELSVSFDPTGDILGCTDPTAVNYNPCATVDDGSCAVVPDECADALDVPVNSAVDGCITSAVGSNLGATFSAASGAPSVTCVDADPAPLDIWFKTTVPASGVVTVQLLQFPGVSTVIEYYLGSCDSLISLSGVIPCSNTQPLTILGLTPGEVLTMRVWDFLSDQFGTIEMCVTEPILGCTDSNATNYDPTATLDDGSCEFPGQPNDECVDATVAAAGDNPFSTIGATGTDITSCTTTDTASVWFVYTVPSGVNNVCFSTCDADYDTGISLWTGCPEDSGSVEVACNDDDLGIGGGGVCGGGLQSSICLNVSTGNVYYVRIAGFGGASGSGNLTIEESAECGKPTNLNVTVETNRALLDWDDVPGAVKYRVRGNRVDLSVLGLLETNVSQKVANNLTPGTTYKWSVRAYCSSDTSGYAPIDTFTTLVLREGLLAESLELAPNPADDQIMLNFLSSSDREVEIMITDITGKVVQIMTTEVSEGPNTVNLDLNKLVEGFYFVQIGNDNSKIQQKFVIAR